MLPLRLCPCQGFELELQGFVDMGVGLATASPGEAPGQMRGGAIGDALAFDWCGRDLVGHGGGQHPLCRKSGNEPQHRGFGLLGMAVGPVGLRRSRQDRQKDRLIGRQMLGLLAEIGQTGHAHPFEIAAEGCEGEVKPKDLLFRIARLQLNRAEDLTHFGKNSAPARFDQARDLHGDGRATRSDMAGGQPLPGRPQHGQRIDTGVLEEAFILRRQQHRQIERINLGGIGREPELSIASREDIEDLAVTGKQYR